MKSLEEILAFQDKNILMRFEAAHPEFPKDEAFQKTVFDDLKRFLWLYAEAETIRKENPEADLPDIGITESMSIIDEIWHEFVLLTQSYIKFCDEYIGFYLHHPPLLTKYQNNRKIKGPEEASEIFVTEMVQTTFDKFGEEIAVRWFDEYFNHMPTNGEDMKADLS